MDGREWGVLFECVKPKKFYDCIVGTCEDPDIFYFNYLSDDVTMGLNFRDFLTQIIPEMQFSILRAGDNLAVLHTAYCRREFMPFQSFDTL